jgi:FkbM family methyltransferase
MSQQKNLEQEQRELFLAGFHPKRFGLFVKVMRRLIWPFVRPFHFFQMSKITQTAHDLGLIEQKSNVLEQKTGEIAKLIKEHVLLRSELAALKNRYIALDSLDDRVNQLSQRHNKLTQRGLLVTDTKSGIFIAKPGEIISDFIIGGGVWDSHIIELAREVAIDHKGGAVDIGAHLGSITLALAMIFDKVFSFEPNDFNFRVLRANVAINNLENVCLFNSGLYSHFTSLSLGEEAKQEISLSLNEQGDFDGLTANNLGAYLFTENGSGLFKHAARTLDSYEFNNIAFIKINVQGADGEVLMGALQTIRRCQPVIVFEWEEMLSKNFNVTLDSIKNELGDLGYEISALKVHNQKQIDYVARPVVFRNE